MGERVMYPLSNEMIIGMPSSRQDGKWRGHRARTIVLMELTPNAPRILHCKSHLGARDLSEFACLRRENLLHLYQLTFPG